MKIEEKKNLTFLSIMTLALSLSIILKAKEEAVATCKKANQTCMIMVSQGHETKYPGLLTL